MGFFLQKQSDFFPHPFLCDKDGFLAFSQGLSVNQLLLAYQFGIFPWYSEGEPVLWWYTHPRCILYPNKLKVSKSMRSYLNQNRFEWTLDKAFDNVIENCAKISRKGQQGTWLTIELVDKLKMLHRKGYAHSVEVWSEGRIVGGLYGIALGKIFYGESMFTLVPNASKFGFIKLVHWLKEKGFELIDCQQETDHMKSFGAEMVSKEYFFKILKKNTLKPTLLGPWNKLENDRI